MVVTMMNEEGYISKEVIIKEYDRINLVIGGVCLGDNAQIIKNELKRSLIRMGIGEEPEETLWKPENPHGYK